ncbi:putative glycosyltransferase EpsE [Microbacterium laevaniformans]|uniref:Putative glycosyltransferase EpsE n=1 Tax=Microbacterium laevaniformans TaxID=36807 RepID=A0A150HCU2_9MICO|nr:glycosyltransferase [Microbacterium laevaniformans]KXZ59929.1 putative glycosyltransferase EpsE [Microbacterium laevaniformans]
MARLARWQERYLRETAGSPMIDILLPYFGDSPHFRAAVKSVITQRSDGWRLICVEDASPSGDASKWLESLSDSRIFHHRNETNLGVAGNFAKCLELVSAPSFTIMGSDDIMLPHHLEVLEQCLSRHPEASFIQPGVEVIDDVGHRNTPLPDVVKRYLRPRTNRGDVSLAGEKLAVSLSRADWAYFPSVLWRSDEVLPIGFDSAYEIALDLGLMLDVALAGGTMVVTAPVSFQYRRHRASASMKAARSGFRFEQERKFFRDYEHRFEGVGWSRAAGVARRHMISRLNAFTEVPAAVAARDWNSAERLLRHTFL